MEQTTNYRAGSILGYAISGLILSIVGSLIRSLAVRAEGASIGFYLMIAGMVLTYIFYYKFASKCSILGPRYGGPAFGLFWISLVGSVFSIASYFTDLTGNMLVAFITFGLGIANFILLWVLGSRLKNEFLGETHSVGVWMMLVVKTILWTIFGAAMLLLLSVLLGSVSSNFAAIVGGVFGAFAAIGVAIWLFIAWIILLVKMNNFYRLDFSGYNEEPPVFPE